MPQGGVQIRFDAARWESALAKLGAQAPKAVARALNRTGTNIRTVMTKEVAADMGLSQKVVREQIYITTATWSRLNVVVSASARRIPLIDFNARGPEPSRGRGRGVTARMPGGAGTYPHAFIATMSNGHRGVFERKGKGRLPLRKELRGASIAKSFNSREDVAQARANEMLTKNVEHEIQYLLTQIKP